ncbi:MAG: glycoside hydrolase family 13 protein [Cyanobacteria bacterium P01_H01_bin.15]
MADCQTPDWVKDAVFYQVFPDRFGQTSLDKDGLWRGQRLEPWSAVPTFEGYKGGDLWAIYERLGYLQELGITALYLTPIFASACNHRYHTHDYYRVDPLLGGEPAFVALLEESHRRGIRLVLDGVFNHVGRGFLFFNDILENGPHSPWLDWFQVLDWPVSAYDGSLPANYVSWVGNRALPQLNHENPQVREYLMQVAEYWIRRGIDGWRLDVPNEITVPGFWSEFRDRIKAINPDAYIVGEIWRDAQPWLQGDQFDGVMNYVFTGPTIAFTAQERVLSEQVAGMHYDPMPTLDAPSYQAKVEALLDRHPWEITLAQLNLLDSHDTARLLSIVEDDRPTVFLATLLLFTFPGAPCIYYGDEVGLPGRRDPDCRRGFPSPEDWDREMLARYKALSQLRHQWIALRRGSYRVLWAEGLTYVFERRWESERLIIGLNAGEVSAIASLGLSELPTAVFGEGAWEKGQGTDRYGLNLTGRTGGIWQLTKTVSDET